MGHQIAAKDESAVRHICSNLPPVLTDPIAENRPDRRSDFKDRLSFLRTNFKGWMSQVQEVSQSITAMLNKTLDEEERKKLEEKQKSVQIALRTTSNLQLLVNNLLQKDATFLGDNSITLSWKKQKEIPPKKDLKKIVSKELKAKSSTKNVRKKKKSKNNRPRKKNKKSNVSRQDGTRQRKFYVPPG